MAKDGWLATPSGRAVSGFGIGLLVATSLASGGGGGQDRPVAPLPLEPLAVADLLVLDDGLGHFVVDLPNSTAAEALAGADGVDSVGPIGGTYWAVTTTLDADGLREVAAGVGARGVSEDVPMVASLATNDPYARWQWALENSGGAVFGGDSGAVGRSGADVGGVEARAASAGRGVVVAVIDSGFQTDHPDLPTDQVWHNDDDCGDDHDDDGNGFVDDCEGWDFVHDDATPYDPSSDNDHGTHVAGTIAAVPDNGIGSAGLAPGVTLMNLKVLEDGAMWMSDGAAAIRYAVDNGADVVNLSWGSTGDVSAAAVASLEAAVDHAAANGVVVVASAGNGGDDLDRHPQYPASLPSEHLLTVGASRADETMATFSNYGADTVDLFAPGEYIIAPVDGGAYAALQGTSAAAPHVAAAAAIVLASVPGMSVDAVESRLLSSVDQAPGYAGRSATEGRLNVASALGIDTDGGDPLAVTVDGVDQLAAGVPGTLTIDARIVDPSLNAGRDVTLRATLLVEHEGEAYALPGLPVTVNGTPTTTDAQASVALSGAEPGTDRTVSGASVRAELGVALPAGTYALALEIVDAADPDVAFGPAQVVFLRIGVSVDLPTTPIDPTAPAVTLPPVPGLPSGLPVPGGSSGSTPTTEPTSGGAPSTGTSPGSATTPTTSASPPAAGGDEGPGRSESPPIIDVGGGNRNEGTPSDGAPDSPDRTDTPRPAAPRRAVPPAEDDADDPAPSTAPADGGGSSSPTTPTTTPSNGEEPRPQRPVEHDGIHINSVRPASGPTAGGNTVTISGQRFPEHARVSFDGRGGQIVSSSDDQLVVVVPSSPVSGAVDVRVADFLGNDVTMPNAYEYLAPSGSPASGGSSTAPSEPTSPSGATTSPTTAASTGTPTTGPATTPATTPTTAGSGATPPDSGGPRPLAGRFRLTLSAEVSSSNGLVMARITAGNPVSASPDTWADLACHESSCQATAR